MSSLEIIKEISENNYNNRITSSIIVDKYELLIVFSAQEKSTNDYYYLYYYNYNLDKKGEKELESISDYAAGHGLFFKACYLYDKHIAFIYCLDYSSCYCKFQMLIINEIYNYYEFNYGLFYQVSINTLNYLVILNDFVKIDNNRLAFISTIEPTKLYFTLFDLYNNYTQMMIRYYIIILIFQAKKF